MKPVRLLLPLVALVAALAFSACGQQKVDTGGPQAESTLVAETEGIYLDLDGLKYQVQVSRQLNPGITEDRDYFEGVAPADRALNADEVWFGIWMLVQNEGDKPIPNARTFEIHDTENVVYRPLQIGPTNNFAYRPTQVGGSTIYPLPDSTPGERPPYGAILLFKLRRASLENRPLELVFQSPTSPRKAIVNLDV